MCVCWCVWLNNYIRVNKFQEPDRPSSNVCYPGAWKSQRNNCDLLLTHKNVYRFTRTEQRAPDNREVQRSPQNFWYSEWNPLPAQKKKKKLDVAATFMENLWVSGWKDVQVAVPPSLRIQLEKLKMKMTIKIQDSRFQGPAYNPVPPE